MLVFCVVYRCSNQSNGENTRRFYHVRTCGVHKGGEIKKLTEKRRKKWLVNLRLRSGGADQIILVLIYCVFFLKLLSHCLF